jgi:hypothetical protein
VFRLNSFSHVMVPALLLVGCSGSKEVSKAAAPKPGEVELLSKPVPTNGKIHTLAKHLELGGFRLAEPKPGTLRIKFNVVNHSQADLGDLEMTVSLVPAGAKPEDAPFCVVKVKVPSMGPEDSKAVEVTAPTKMRVYEMPDWQFIRAQFEITSPPA